MAGTQDCPVTVHTTGAVSAGMRKVAEIKIGGALHHVGRPVLSARVVLTMAADPAVARPAAAQATVSVNGQVVRAQASARTMGEAVDYLVQRLRVRLARNRAAHGRARRQAQIRRAYAGNEAAAAQVR